MTPDMLDFNNSILTITMLLSSAGIVFISAYVHVNSQRSTTYLWFQAWMAQLFVWNWSYMLRQVAPNHQVAWVLFCMEVIAVAGLGPVLLSFARGYRGWQNRNAWSVWLAFAGAGMIILTLFTNQWHGSFIVSFSQQEIIYGLPYYIFGIFELICFSATIAYFVNGTRRPSIYWKNQLYNVGGSMLVLAIAALLQVFGFFHTSLNVPLVLLPFSLMFICIAIMKYQFLDILPFTLSEAVNYIDDGYMIFNNGGELEDYNLLFFKDLADLGGAADIHGVTEIFGGITDKPVSLTNLAYSLNVDRGSFISGELLFRLSDGPMHIQYTTKAITDDADVKVASMVTFHNITELQTLYQTLEEKKAELIRAKKQLETHINTVQELTVETERNRLMAQVHDTLGHSMAEVLALLEQCDLLLQDQNPDQERGLRVIDEALKQSRTSLAEIRAAVSDYRKMGAEIR